MKEYLRLYEFKYDFNFSISNAAFDLMTQDTSAAVKDSQINSYVFKKVKLHYKLIKKRHLCHFIKINDIKICSQCERKKKRKQPKDYCKDHDRYFFIKNGECPMCNKNKKRRKSKSRGEKGR